MIDIKNLTVAEKEDYESIKDKTFEDLKNEKIGDHPFFLRWAEEINKLFAEVDKRTELDN